MANIEEQTEATDSKSDPAVFIQQMKEVGHEVIEGDLTCLMHVDVGDLTRSGLNWLICLEPYYEKFGYNGDRARQKLCVLKVAARRDKPLLRLARTVMEGERIEWDGETYTAANGWTV